MATLADVNIAMREQVTHLERRFGRRRVYFVAGAIGLVLLLLLVRLVVVGKKPAPQPAPRPVIVAKVITRDVPLYLDEIGTCVSVESVKVQAQVSGQIIAREFQDGADVKKGDLLFTIDPRPYQAALDQAKGQLAQAQSQLVLDQITLKRQQELRARGVNAPQDLDVAQGTFNNDKAKVQAAQAAVDAAQVNLDYCTIRSPLDGRAGLRTVDVGNVISGGNAGGVVLLSIDRFDQIYTDFTVAEPDIALVRHYLGNPNMKVQTDSPNDDQPPRLGDLYFIDNVVQPGSGTVKARGITPNPDRSLWPGEFVRVRFILDQIKDAMAELLEPELRETAIGHAEVKQVFQLSKGIVAGCLVTNGRIARSARARVLRKRQPVYDGGISTLRRFQDDVKEVRSGLECGIKLGDFSEYQVGDIIECYQLEQIAQKL